MRVLCKPGPIDQRQTARTRARYDRQANTLDFGSGIMDRLGAAAWRRRLWAQAQGPRVLEVGVGTGANFPYYPPDIQVMAVDLSPRLLERAHRRTLREAVGVDLRVMDAQALELADNTFDTMAATWVFCSVPDPLLGLQEAFRVLKPGGLLLLLEHVRAEGTLGLLQDFFNPIMVRISGANMNRRTVDNVRLAGFKTTTVKPLARGLVRFIAAVADKGGGDHEASGSLEMAKAD